MKNTSNWNLGYSFKPKGYITVSHV